MNSYLYRRAGDGRFVCLHSASVISPKFPQFLSNRRDVMNIARRIFCLLVAALCLLTVATAQVQTSELHVLVKDAKGAVVGGATVTAAEPGKGVSRIATSNTEG